LLGKDLFGQALVGGLQLFEAASGLQGGCRIGFAAGTPPQVDAEQLYQEYSPGKNDQNPTSAQPRRPPGTGGQLFT